ncbi:MAG: hypothetical protein HC818_00820 [Synechococcaceae cyanobacterium RM1_1_27]|nr:hypothetical protein [Synechococcaceae cyanobacterium RM1_1_27]
MPDPSASPDFQSADNSCDGEGMAMQITAAQPQDWGQIEGSSTGIPVLRPKAQNAQAA